MRKNRRGEPDCFDDDMFRDTFARYGTVVRAVLSKDRDTGASKGFGFVSFSRAEEADAAVEVLGSQQTTFLIWQVLGSLPRRASRR